MKKIEIIVILLIVILVSGCSKQYNLIVENDKITEEFNISFDDTEENMQRYNLDYFPLHANQEAMYVKKIDKKNKLLKAHFNYTYKPSEFVNANSINECFETKEIIVEAEDYYYFKLQNLKSCMSDYNIDINIITKNKVLENNADEVNKNKYTWHITDKNKDKFNLEIKIDKKKSEKGILGSFSLVLISLIAIIGIIIFLSILIIKRNKSNKI